MKELAKSRIIAANSILNLSYHQKSRTEFDGTPIFFPRVTKLPPHLIVDKIYNGSFFKDKVYFKNTFEITLEVSE